jgi:hypothetical protein
MIIMVKDKSKQSILSTNAASHNKNTYTRTYYPFETKWLLPIPSGITFQNPIFCLHNISVHFVPSKQAALLDTALPE